MVQIDKDEIRLNSRMEELAFAKTNYDSAVTQKGLLAVAQNSKKDELLSFSFSDYSFSDVISFKTEGFNTPVVYYCGKNVLTKNAKTYLALSKTDNFEQFGFALCTMLTQAAKEDIKVPSVGAGGIIIDITPKTTSILILPEDLYKFSVVSLNQKDYSNYHAHWLNSSIYDLPSLCFERGAIAYHLITNQIPFPTENQLERNADFLDNNFIPIEYYCKNIEHSLQTSINKALKLNANVVNIPGKKKKGKASEDLSPEKDFPLKELQEFLKNKNSLLLDEKSRAEKCQDFAKRQKSKITLKRKLRRNKTTIIISILAIIACALIVRAGIISSGENYTSVSLSSKDTILAYFKGVNKKDSVLLDNFTKGGNTRSYNDVISNIFVISKMRQTNNIDSGFLSPGHWLFEAASEESFERAGLYGVTNFNIDGTVYDVNINIPLKKEKPEPLPIQNKTTSYHTVSYNLIHNASDDFTLTNEEISGTIELTFKKNRWIITNFLTQSKENKIDTAAFKQDYLNALQQTNMNVYQAVELLKPKYNWLCDQNEISAGLEEIKDRTEYINQFNVSQE